MGADKCLKPNRGLQELRKGKPKANSARLELRLFRRNFFVSAFGAYVVAESANPGLCDDQFAIGEFQRDLAFLFRVFGFEDGSVAFDRGDTVALPLVGHRPLRRFVFVNAGKFNLETLFTQRPDFELAALGFPRAVDLSSRDTFLAVGV